MSLIDDVEDRLKRAILRGELSPGERLPAERSLSERFDASRVSVRAALARLSGQGLLSVRQGQGYTVQDFRLRGGPGLLPDLFAAVDDPRAMVGDVLLIRRHLAAAALHLIASARPDTTALRQAIDAFEQTITSDPDSLPQADLAIVAALLAATGSLVLQVSINPIAALISEYAVFNNGRYRQPEINLAGWRALLAWAGDPDPALIPTILALLEERDRDTLEAPCATPSTPG